MRAQGVRRRRSRLRTAVGSGPDQRAVERVAPARLAVEADRVEADLVVRTMLRAGWIAAGLE
jgi:hypothetical protein